MCGIVGCILKDDEDAAPVLLECVKKLEYRGYDSVGIATVSDKINIKKDKGEIEDVDAKLNLADMPGNYGIAHVRWATHGVPSKENSHPQIDNTGKIAVVHNGIIEHYESIKEELIAEGHVFRSDTDTEVIPHLIERYMDQGMDLEGALRETINILHGAYAIAAISLDDPEKIVATRKDSPLIVGVGDSQYFVASDSPAILEYTRNIIYPERDEIVILEPSGVTIKDKDGNTIEKEIEVVDWTPKMAQKEGYDFFMIKEINEQADAVKNTLFEKENIEKIIEDLDDINRICFVACGTSYHASLIGKYLIESLSGIPVDVILASEFKYSANTLNEQTLVIFISQSGETADTLKALDMAKGKSKTLGIVNVVGSAITRKADYVINTKAGPEIGVAATKTYLAQLTAIYMFAGLLAENNNLMELVDRVPEFIEELLLETKEIKKMAAKYKDKDDFYFIGRDFSYPIALEGALKLKEITYIHAEGYAAGELKHGPLALIDTGVPVVVILPPGENHRKTMGNLEEVKSRGANVIAIGAYNDSVLISKADEVFTINSDVTDIISPLVYIVPLQMLAYYIAIERELDPDKPKNLAKCVTVQ